MKGSIHNRRDSHPQCVCGRVFASMGRLVEHWSLPCEGDTEDKEDGDRPKSPPS